MNHTRAKWTGGHKINFWVVLAIVPVSFLAVAEYLRNVLIPDAVFPINPTYLKYFAAQSVLVIAIFLRLFNSPREERLELRTSEGSQLTHAFPILLLLFGAWNLFSLTWAAWEFGATNEMLYFTTYLGLAFIFYLSLQSPERWMVFAKVFLVSVALAAAWQLQTTLRMALPNDDLTIAKAFLSRPLMFGNVNFSCSSVVTGALLSLGFLIIFVQSFWRDSNHQASPFSIVKALSCLAALIAFCAVLYFASSLAGYIAGFIAILAYVLCMLPCPKIRALLSFGIGVTAIAAIVIILYTPKYRQRVTQWALQRGTTTRARMVWWTATGDMFVERPILGWGVGSYGSVYYRFSPPISDTGPPTRGVAATHPHNEFLRVAAELGSIGLILYFLIFIVTLVTSYRILQSADFRHRAIGFAAWAGLLGFLTQAALGKGIQIWDMALPFWILTGALAAMHRWAGASPATTPSVPRRLQRFTAILIAPALLCWWIVGGVSGYRSMIHLKDAYNRVNALARFARKNKSQKNQQAVRATVRQAADDITKDLRSCRPFCPVTTLPLRLRYTLGINLTSVGLNARACEEFAKVDSMAPSFLVVEKFLARCQLRKGNKKQARDLLLSFLDHHPTRMDGYLMLAPLDLPAATRHLARQVLERDALSHPRRTATLARMLTVLQRWNDLKALLNLSRQHATPQTYHLTGQQIAQTCKRRGYQDKLAELRREFPDAFPPHKNP